MSVFGEHPEWHAQAACRGVDQNVFFTERGQSTAPAKLICAACPVRKECLDFALENGEKFGVFGGKSERERRVRNADRKPGGVAVRCGTMSGVAVHQRLDEPPCAECREKRNAHERDLRWKRANGLAS